MQKPFWLMAGVALSHDATLMTVSKDRLTKERRSWNMSRIRGLVAVRKHHDAGEDCALAAASDGLPVSTARADSSANAERGTRSAEPNAAPCVPNSAFPAPRSAFSVSRHRSGQTARCDLRPRLLLAPAQGMQELHDADEPARMVAGETQRQRRARQTPSGRAQEIWLACDCDLGSLNPLFLGIDKTLRKSEPSSFRMANAVFTTKVNPVYDDLPEFRYHFPKTYLAQAEQAVGDFIVYYEPRRESADLSGTAGRQSYFATARVVKIEPDAARPDHFYAHVTDYLEFVKPVPFKIGEMYLESLLRKEDGSTNKGRFGRSVRIITSTEFDTITRLGFDDSDNLSPTQSNVMAFSEESVPYGRSSRTVISERPFREAAFGKIIRKAYRSTCAMTGLKLINGGGRCEIEAAHIQPVEAQGPDSPRNGIALSRTIHWLFDRGILSISDDGDILMARKLVPEPIRRMLNPNGKVIFPTEPTWTPHREFVRYHREVNQKKLGKEEFSKLP
jgi:putative restriction endonuclease